jgi:hypothetical protein
MTHYRTMYDRDYIGAFDLPENKDVVVTIEKVVAGDLTGMGGKKSKKPVISLVGKEKKFVCNVTNAKTIAALYGPQVEDWVGKRIALYVSTTRDPGGGEDVFCIRVRPKVPVSKSTLTPEQDGAPTVAEVSKMISAGKLDDAADMARGFPEAERAVLQQQIEKARAAA